MRWQYKIVGIGMFNAAQRLGMTLSYFGERGWELITVYDKASNWVADTENGFMLFKRAVPEGTEPDGPWAEHWSPAAVEAAFVAARQT